MITSATYIVLNRNDSQVFFSHAGHLIDYPTGRYYHESYVQELKDELESAGGSGEWRIFRTEKDWYIISTKTGKKRKIGARRGTRVDYFKRAMEEVDRLNGGAS